MVKFESEEVVQTLNFKGSSTVHCQCRKAYRRRYAAQKSFAGFRPEQSLSSKNELGIVGLQFICKLNKQSATMLACQKIPTVNFSHWTTGVLLSAGSASLPYKETLTVRFVLYEDTFLLSISQKFWRLLGKKKGRPSKFDNDWQTMAHIKHVHRGQRLLDIVGRERTRKVNRPVPTSGFSVWCEIGEFEVYAAVANNFAWSSALRSSLNCFAGRSVAWSVRLSSNLVGTV